jgi:hypothetical protein
VNHTFLTEDRSVIEVTLKSGAQEETFKVTPTHPFMTARGWVEASALEPSDAVLSLDDSWSQVVDVVDRGEVTTVYNFEVDELHTYLVGDQGAMVHNACTPNFTRALQSSDFGPNAALKAVDGTFGVQGEVATVGIRYIEGNLGNPIAAFNALKDAARNFGAKTLRIEATIANERLLPVLNRLLGPSSRGASGGMQDAWTISL